MPNRKTIFDADSDDSQSISNISAIQPMQPTKFSNFGNDAKQLTESTFGTPLVTKTSHSSLNKENQRPLWESTPMVRNGRIAAPSDLLKQKLNISGGEIPTSILKKKRATAHGNLGFPARSPSKKNLAKGLNFSTGNNHTNRSINFSQSVIGNLSGIDNHLTVENFDPTGILEDGTPICPDKTYLKDHPEILKMRIQEILDFLRRERFQKELTLKQFSPPVVSSTDFFFVVKFIINQDDPLFSFENPNSDFRLANNNNALGKSMLGTTLHDSTKGNLSVHGSARKSLAANKSRLSSVSGKGGPATKIKREEIVINYLQMMGYPHSLPSKKAFSSISQKSAWPQFASCLIFLYESVQSDMKFRQLFQNMKDDCFDNMHLDEDRAEKINKVQLFNELFRVGETGGSAADNDNCYSRYKNEKLSNKAKEKGTVQEIESKISIITQEYKKLEEKENRLRIESEDFLACQTKLDNLKITRNKLRREREASEADLLESQQKDYQAELNQLQQHKQILESKVKNQYNGMTKTEMIAESTKLEKDYNEYQQEIEKMNENKNEMADENHLLAKETSTLAANIWARLNLELLSHLKPDFSNDENKPFTNIQISVLEKQIEQFQVKLNEAIKELKKIQDLNKISIDELNKLKSSNSKLSAEKKLLENNLELKNKNDKIENEKRLKQNIENEQNKFAQVQNVKQRISLLKEEEAILQKSYQDFMARLEVAIQEEQKDILNCKKRYKAVVDKIRKDWSWMGEQMEREFEQFKKDWEEKFGNTLDNKN